MCFKRVDMCFFCELKCCDYSSVSVVRFDVSVVCVCVCVHVYVHMCVCVHESNINDFSCFNFVFSMIKVCVFHDSNEMLCLGNFKCEVCDSVLLISNLPLLT